jgi:hypothetical protein
MSLNIWQKIALVAFLPMVPFWIILNLIPQNGEFWGYMFSFCLALIPLIGGGFSLFHAGRWGGIKSAIGRVVIFLGLGLFLWGCGGMIWSYHNFILKDSMPYPSLADAGFAGGVLFYCLGAFYLSRATGAKFTLRSTSAQIFTVVTSILVFGLAYYIFVIVARDGVLIADGSHITKAVLDVVYPVGDFVALLLAVVISGLSFQYLVGKYVLDVYSILTGLAIMFVADSLFSYSTTVGTYYNGHPADLFFALGMFLMTFGLLGLCTNKVSDK